MKLNFWQVVGLIVVTIALIFIIRREAGERTQRESSGTPTAPVVSAPDTAPATAPAP
jgi:hypothetical protein